MSAFLRELRSPGVFLSALFLAVLIVLAVFAPLVVPFDPIEQSGERLAGPSAAHLLGTDQFGRDVFSRLVYGSRIDLVVAFGASALAAAIGVLIGLIGGTSKGIVNMLSMRSIEVILAFPPIVFALMIVTMVGPGAGTLVVTMGVLFAPAFARIVYGEVLTLRNLEYVQASTVIGTPRPRILLRVILPGVIAPVLVQLSLTLASSLLLSSGLSYLGLGVVPPEPSWGGMIAEGQGLMARSPLLLLVAGGIVVATVLAFSVLADALERSLDPRRRRSKSIRRVSSRTEVIQTKRVSIGRKLP